jgi:hypothetical protein
MIDITHLESGYDYITLYFEKHGEMTKHIEKLYKYMIRVDFKYLDIQRKNLVHKPGDVPHFHNGIDATLGPHVHVLYPHRPSEEDWEELKTMLKHRLVGIHLDESIENKEIC